MSMTTPQPFPIGLTPLELDEAIQHTEEVPYLLSHAAQVFRFLGRGVSLGYVDENGPVITSICELACRALTDAAEHEGETVFRLNQKLRKAKEALDANQS